MSRLGGGGFEGGHRLVDGLSVGGTPTYDSTDPITGDYSLACDGSGEYVAFPITESADRNFYARYKMRVSALPTASCQIFTFLDGITPTLAAVTLRADGKFQIASTLSTVVVVPDQVYTLELRYLKTAAGNVTAELRVDGVLAISVTQAQAALADGIRMGYISASGTIPILTIDDWAVNDDQGADDNTWVGVDEKFALLLPAADSLRDATWLGAAGGTANLFEALNNLPPAGLSTTNGTDASQIESISTGAAATDRYRPQLEAYNAKLPAGASVEHVQAVTMFGSQTSTAKPGSIKGVSSPALAKATANSSGAQGAFPTGWVAIQTAIAVDPAVALTDQPVLEVEREHATTDRPSHCLMGMMVGYIEGTPDVTPPVVTIDSITGFASGLPATQLGPGSDEAVLEWAYTADEMIVAYELRRVDDPADDRLEGDLLDSGGTGPTLSYEGSVHEDNLAPFGPGVHNIKLFVKDEAENWSTAPASPSTEIEYVAQATAGGIRRLGARRQFGRLGL